MTRQGHFWVARLIAGVGKGNAGQKSTVPLRQSPALLYWVERVPSVPLTVDKTTQGSAILEELVKPPPPPPPPLLPPPSGQWWGGGWQRLHHSRVESEENNSP